MRINPLEAIGTELEQGVDVATALSRSALNFEVKLVPEKNAVTGEPILDSAGEPRFYQAVRTDNNHVIMSGIGQRQVIFQNMEVLAPLAEAFVAAGAKINRATVIDGGERVFLGFEWNDRHNLNVKGDIVGCRGLIQGSHGGRYAHCMYVYPLRLACVNGLMIPVPQFGYMIRIKHTRGGEEKLRESVDVLKESAGYFGNFGKIAHILAGCKVSQSHAEQIVKSVRIGSDKKPLADEKGAEILNLFNGDQVQANHEALRGTAWGLLNAGAEAADYGEANGRVRISRGTDEGIQRFKRALDGSGTSMMLKLALHNALMDDGDLGLKEQYKAVAKASLN